MSIKYDLIEQIFDERFGIDIQSFQVSIAGKETNFTAQGFGWVRQSAKQFEYKVYVKEFSGNEKDFLTFDQSEDSKRKHQFTATDVEGNTWRFSTTGIGRKGILGSFKPYLPSLSGNINSIEFDDRSNNQTGECFVELTFEDDGQFPFNLPESQGFNDDGIWTKTFPDRRIDCEFEDLKTKGIKHENIIILRFSGDLIKNHPYAEMRLRESLQFITGRRLRPGIIVKQTKDESHITFYANHKNNHFYFEQPIFSIDDWKMKYSKQKWEIFYKFLKSVIEYHGKNYSPLGSIINGVIGAGEIYFDTRLLVLSVKIESLVKLLYSDYAKPNSLKIKLVQDLLEHMVGWDVQNDIGKKVLDQACGKIGNLMSPSTSDNLKRLRNTKVITSKQLEAWNSARNKYAHGGIASSANFSKIQKRYLLVLEMFYRMIFFAIGYEKEFTAYSDDREVKIFREELKKT